MIRRAQGIRLAYDCSAYVITMNCVHLFFTTNHPLWHMRKPINQNVPELHSALQMCFSLMSEEPSPPAPWCPKTEPRDTMRTPVVTHLHDLWGDRPETWMRTEDVTENRETPPESCHRFGLRAQCSTMLFQGFLTMRSWRSGNR